MVLLVKTWMASHNLLLNEQKTEVVVIAAPNRSRVHRPVVVAIDVRYAKTVYP